MTVQGAFNMPAKVFGSLEESAFNQVVGLKDRLSDINNLLHRTTFNAIANGLTGPKMMHCTTPMSKHLFSSLQALARPSVEITLPLVDYVVPNLHRACFFGLMGNSTIPDTAADLHMMDSGAYYLLSNVPSFARKSLKSRSRLVSALSSYVQETLENKDVEGASPIITDLIHQLHDDNYSVDESARILLFVFWG